MLSDTLIAGLRRYEIGSKIRDLRVKKKLGLVQLGEHTGLSPALLSKIERGQLFPTLPTLLASRWCSASVSIISSSRAKTGHWWSSPKRRIECVCPIVLAKSRHPIL